MVNFNQSLYLNKYIIFYNLYYDYDIFSYFYEFKILTLIQKHINDDIYIIVELDLESVLKSVLKRQLPYLIGGTITGIIITYYYGFLFSIIVNSAIWFAISTVVKKYYWHYTGFKDEFYLISKYINNRKKNKTSHNYDISKEDYKKSQSSNLKLLPKNDGDDKTSNIGSPIKS